MSDSSFHIAKQRSRICLKQLLLTCALALLLACVCPTFAIAGDNPGDATAPTGGLFSSKGLLAAENPVLEGGNEPIASGEAGTCIWVIGADGKLTISPETGTQGELDYASDLPPWYSFASQITAAEFEGAISISGSKMGWKLFYECSNLSRVDLTGLDASQAENLSFLFYGCRSLTSSDLSMLDISSAQSLNNMFSHCSKLVSVQLPKCSTTNLQTMSNMFQHCTSLESIDLSSIDTSHVTKATGLFYNCSSLRKITVGSKWDLFSHTASYENGNSEYERMFTKCDALVGANGTSFADAKVEDQTYARIDTLETPGYLWPADNESGNGDDNGNGQGSGNDNGESGENSTGGNGSSNANSGASTSSTTSGGNGTSGSTSRKPAPTTTKAHGNPTVTLSADTFTYNGKARIPSVKVKLGGKTLKSGRDYAVKYPKKRKAIGTYKVTIIGKDSYKFKASRTFRIIPKTPKLKTLKAHKNSDGSSGFITSWKRGGKKAIGYEIRWSSAKSFKKAESFAFKGSTPFAKKGTAALRVRTRAWLGKKAFVQIRAFKTIKGEKYYSKWSKARKVRLKK